MALSDKKMAEIACAFIKDCCNTESQVFKFAPDKTEKPEETRRRFKYLSESFKQCQKISATPEEIMEFFHSLYPAVFPKALPEVSIKK